MYLIGSLLLALGITVFIVSKIAEMMHAKKPAMERVLMASLVGSIAAVATLIALSVFVKDVDPIYLMIGSVLAMLLVSTLAFKAINVMSWSGAITTNIANVALVLLTGTAAVVLNDVSMDKAIQTVRTTFSTNTAMVEGIATGKEYTPSIVEAGSDVASADQVLIDDDIDPTFKEIDLLPAGTVKEIKDKKKIVFREPKYRVISLSNARSAVGHNIRIKNKSGNSIVGALKNIRSNDLVVEQRINGGLATTPISFAKIQKLEVYR